MLKKLYCLIIICQFLIPSCIKAQDISLYTQINGRYDFTFIGNTMGPDENEFQYPTFLYTESSATLNLASNDRIERAYLYWAGSGVGDTNVKLNGIDMSPDILSTVVGTSSNLTYFSAFKDITAQVQSFGNGTYTLSDFDINSLVDEYAENATQFAGWAILVVYENPNLTLNQINIYQGLEALSPNPYVIPPVIDTMTIQLNNLYLISNTGAKIGFIAWEGDRMIQEAEILSFSANGTTLRPPAAPKGTRTVRRRTRR